MQDDGTRLAARITAFAAPVFLAACAVPDGGLFRAARFRDVHLYGEYADAFLRGEIPYRDFFVEYPPGAFAVFLPPALLPADAYNFAFKSLMALCGIGAIFALLLVLTSLGVRGRRLYVSAGLVALSPLAVGPISLNTYDLWPAALTIGALAALLRGRELLAFSLLGLAVTAKVYPLALVPLAAVYAWTELGPRRTRNGLLAFAAAIAAVVVPFAIAAPQGLWDSIDAQASRGLQIESLGGAILLAADQLGLYGAVVVRGVTGAASRDLAGVLPDAIAAAMSVLQAAAVVGAWLLYARSPRDPQRLAIAFAAATTAFLVFSRFVSPQYLVWLIPLVLLVPGRLRVLATALLCSALVLGQLWFFHYRDVFALESIVWLVVARDLILLSLCAVLLAAIRDGRSGRARAP